MTLTHFRPAAIVGIMGHVKDTPNVNRIEIKYGTVLIGASAKWIVVNTKAGDVYRVQIEVNGRWRGVFPMTKDDLEIY